MLDRTEDLLVVDRVTAGYPGTIVLRDVSLRVGPGEVVALLGPNGAGKTTLLRVASGLLRAERGEVRMFGEPVAAWRPSARAQAGLCHIPEGRGIFRNLSVRENLVVQSPPGRTDESLERAIGAFPRLGERLAQRAGTLSGGEQQMLALARAYSQAPRLVLADEPSLGLAPNLVDEIFDFLRRVAAEGAALLLVEQYVHRALAVADRVYVLRKGRVELDGRPEDFSADTVADSYLGPSTGRRR